MGFLRLCFACLLLCAQTMYGDILAKVNQHVMTSYDLEQLKSWQHWLHGLTRDDHAWVQHWVKVMAQYDALNDLKGEWQHQKFELYHPQQGIITDQELIMLLASTNIDSRWIKHWLEISSKVSYMRHHYFKTLLTISDDEIKAFHQAWNERPQSYHIWLIQVPEQHQHDLLAWSTHPRLSNVHAPIIATDQGWKRIHDFAKSVQDDLLQPSVVTPIYFHEGHYWMLLKSDIRLEASISLDKAYQMLKDESIQYLYQQWSQNAIDQAEIRIHHGQT
ncbi:MAG: hypothetical protein ACON5A_02440 [Candidatus Comchoanobacterales bacterium]